MKTRALAIASLLSMACPAAQAAIVFQFTYTDPAGVGFNDPLAGAARKAALVATGALLSSYFPGYDATIHITVDGAETTDGVLAAAGSEFNAGTACDVGFGSRGDVALKVLGGADPAAGADGTVTVNFEDQAWDLDDTVAPGTFDFKSTMLHELLHAMGWSNSVTQSGEGGCAYPAGTPSAWGPYDDFLGDSAGELIGNATFVLNLARWDAAVVGGTGNAGLLWRGAQGSAANGNQPVPLYSPVAFSEGSSVAHLDDDFFTDEALLMEAAAEAGQGTRTLSPREEGMLKDLGYANVDGTPAVDARVFRDGFEG